MPLSTDQISRLRRVIRQHTKHEMLSDDMVNVYAHEIADCCERSNTRHTTTNVRLFRETDILDYNEKSSETKKQSTQKGMTKSAANDPFHHSISMFKEIAGILCGQNIENFQVLRHRTHRDDKELVHNSRMKIQWDSEQKHFVFSALTDKLDDDLYLTDWYFRITNNTFQTQKDDESEADTDSEEEEVTVLNSTLKILENLHIRLSTLEGKYGKI